MLLLFLRSPIATTAQESCISIRARADELLGESQFLDVEAMSMINSEWRNVNSINEFQWGATNTTQRGSIHITLCLEGPRTQGGCSSKC
jgi:hypothetical protein